MIKKRIYGALLLCIMGLFLAGCAAGQEEPAEGKVGDEQVVPVEVISAARGDLALEREKGARLTAAREAMVMPAMPGEVVEVLVSVGEHVEKDQVLIRLDDSAVQQQIDQAQAAYNSAAAAADLSRQSRADLEAQKAEAQANLDEYYEDVNLRDTRRQIRDITNSISDLNTAFINGVIPQEEYDVTYRELTQARDQLSAVLAQETMLEQAVEGIDNAIDSLPFSEDTLNAQLTQASLGVSAAKEALDALVLKAPAAGTVSSVQVSVGDFATQSMPPVTIIDTESLILQVPLTEYEVTRITASEQVHMTVDAFDRGYEGVVEWVSPAIDPRTQSYYARVRVDNADGRLRPGMYARARIVVDETEDAVLLPKDALVREESTAYVYLIEEGAARRVAVTLGLDDGYTIEILAGLSTGDLVVTKGQAYLNDGIAIEIMEGDAS